MRYIRIFIVALLFSPYLNAQKNSNKEVQQIFKKVNDNYEKNNYLSITTNYKYYKDYTTKNPSENYSGEIVKKNGSSYYKIKDFEFLEFNEYNLKISNSEKAVVWSKSKKISTSPIALDNYFNGFNSKIIPNSKYWICELTPNKFSQVMINKAIIYINKSDYSIESQELFFLSQGQTKSKTGEIINNTPRLLITYSSREKKEKSDEQLTNQKNYFTVTGKKIVLAKKYSTYKLLQS